MIWTIILSPQHSLVWNSKNIQCYSGYTPPLLDIYNFYFTNAYILRVLIGFTSTINSSLEISIKSVGERLNDKGCPNGFLTFHFNHKY